MLHACDPPKHANEVEMDLRSTVIETAAVGHDVSRIVAKKTAFSHEWETCFSKAFYRLAKGTFH
jgi:hypothetical protein